MQFVDIYWRHGEAARANLTKLAYHNAAFWGRTALAGMCWSLAAPQTLLAAMARGVADPANPVEQLNVTPKASPDEEAPAAAEAEQLSPRLLDAPRGGVADNLSRIRGVGPKLATSLQEVGIYHFDQIAELNQEGLDWLTTHLPGFRLAARRFDLPAGAAECLAEG